MSLPYKKSLNAAWTRWQNWCIIASFSMPHVDMYRPSIELYCSFLDFYLSFYKHETVKSYLKRINTFAVQETGQPIHSHLNKLWIRRTFVAAAKEAQMPAACKRLPLTVEILTKLRPFVNFSRNDGRALWAILCVGVFSLARIGELVPGHSSKLKVTLRAVDIKGNRGALNLIGTKTDHEQKGSTILFFGNKSSCCPITAMQAYITGRPQTASSAPLFINSRSERLTQYWVLNSMRSLLDKAGFDGKDFSGISLRRGGAQTLLKLQANDTIIMGMGRWKSACFNRYLHVSEPDRLQLAFLPSLDRRLKIATSHK